MKDFKGGSVLTETKEQIQTLVNKINTIDFVMEKLQTSHKDDSVEIEKQFKLASTHKLKLTSELLRLLGADKVLVD